MAATGGFDSTTVSFVDDHDEAVRRLLDDDLDAIGFISDASNGAILCTVGAPDEQLYAVYKPGQFERPLWDFPGDLYPREVAAFLLSERLGWGLVPPTVLREDGPRGPGSLQLFVPHSPAEHYFRLIEADGLFDETLAKLAMFDMVANNADRKGGHVLRWIDTDRLYGIDNGLTFHVEPKLRTVVWDQPHIPFADAWKADLAEVRDELADDGELAESLNAHLTIAEVAILADRCDQVIEMDAVPEIDPDERWYPWPPI